MIKLKKISSIILLFAIFFQIFSPIGVLALETVDSSSSSEDISSYVKDGSENVDFNYEFSIRDAFNLIYNQENIEDYIKTYITEKIGDDYIVEINLHDDINTYTLIKDDNEIYSGTFTYSINQILDVILNKDKIESIKQYIFENTDFKDNIDIIEKSDNQFIITINNISHEYNVNFIENSIEEIIDNSTYQNEVTGTIIDEFKNEHQQSKVTTNASQVIEYQAHVQGTGWQSVVGTGEISGTTGEGKRLEALKITLVNQNYSGSIEYQSHIQGVGWETDWKNSGELTGTTGEGKRLEAIRIRLTGEMAEHYSIYYRVHTQGYGWLDWAKNGEDAGTAGFSYRLEAIQIVLVEKDGDAPGSTDNAFIQRYITYKSHVQNVGWQSNVYDGVLSGTTGEGKRLEALAISLCNQKYTGDIEYQSHIQGIGWENVWHKNGETSGTVGEGKRLEAIRIRLTGEMAKHYDVYYRVHTQGYGWLDWAKNGENAGTAGFSYRLEAIQIILVEKGESAPGSTNNAYVQRYIQYQGHVQGIGWQGIVYDGALSGTTDQSRRLEAITIKLSNQAYNGNVEYQTSIEDSGWENVWHKNGETSGTVGKGKRLEAVRIRLTGEMVNHYDIYYRAYTEKNGWLDWAKNGESAGTEGFGYRLEAIEVMLVEKDGIAPGNTELPFIFNEISYQSHNASVGWQNSVYNGNISGTIGKNLEAFIINDVQSEYSGNINYASYVNNIGWQDYVSDGSISGTTGEGLGIEAIKIKLTGELENTYDIYYSVYISNIGWLDWAKNDEVTGNVGYGNSIQAIKVQLVEKGASAPGPVENIYSEAELKINYDSYVEGSGWQGIVSDGSTSGTTGDYKKVESIKISVNKKIVKGSVSYSAHISGSGWQTYVADGEEAGKIGGRIEAIKIKLTGNLSEQYDIYYRVHVADVGWMTWASNDSPAGTTGGGKRIEALEIKLVEKGNNAPENIGNNVDSPYLEARWETDSSGNKYYYDVKGNLVTSGGYKIGDTTYYFGPTGIYLGTKNLTIIDVSAHQYEINWAEVVSSGIYGVIIRISAGCDYEDAYLARNISEVKKYNIPYGIYIYSYAENYNEGTLYARFTQSIINKYSMNPTLGIYLDLERNNITDYMGTTEYTQVVQGFMSVLPNAKIYTYTNYANTALNTSYLRSYITWIAEYNPTCAYTGSYKMWQYTSTGSLPGINGNVDMSILYSF